MSSLVPFVERFLAVTLALTCTALHAMIPALTPGVTVLLARRPDGGLALEVPCTPSVLSRVAQAIRDGALVANPTDWDEIERMVEADRDRMRAKAQAILDALTVTPSAKAG